MLSIFEDIETDFQTKTLNWTEKDFEKYFKSNEKYFDFAFFCDEKYL